MMSRKDGSQSLNDNPRSPTSSRATSSSKSTSKHKAIPKEDKNGCKIIYPTPKSKFTFSDRATQTRRKEARQEDSPGRKACESLIETLLNTDTYLFTQVLERLQDRCLKRKESGESPEGLSSGNEEGSTSNFCRSEFGSDSERASPRPMPENRESTTLSKINNKLVEILPTITDSKETNLTATSYKTVSTVPFEDSLKIKNILPIAKARSCFNRISNILNIVSEPEIKISNAAPEEFSKSTDFQQQASPLVHLHNKLRVDELSAPSKSAISVLEMLCKSKQENIDRLLKEKQKLGRALKDLEYLIGPLEAINPGIIDELMTKRQETSKEIQTFLSDTKELQLDCVSYQSILNDNHPTYCLFSMIRSGLREEYEHKKKYLEHRNVNT